MTSAFNITPAEPAHRRGMASWRARTLLLALVFVCLVPGVIGIGVLIYRMYEDGRRQIETETIRTARAMVQAVDRQLDGARLLALALSSSDTLRASDWAGLHRRASELVQIEGIGVNVVLSDPAGQQIVNTAVPFEGFARAYADGVPLFLTPVSEEIAAQWMLAAHSLRGAIESIGFKGLSAKIQALETELKVGQDLSAAAQRAAEIHRQLARIFHQ